MKDTKIYTFLSHLNVYELNWFRKYIESPYFNKNTSLIKLFDLLEEHIRSKSEIELQKQDIWLQIFKDQIFDDKKFRKACSDLLDLGEGFIAQQVYDKNPLHQARYLMEGIHEKRVEKLYNSAIETAKRLSTRQLYKPASYYYYNYEIERLLYKLSEVELKRASKESLDKLNLIQIINNLDHFYLAEKLKYYCSLLTWKKVLDLNYDVLFIDEIIKYIGQHDYSKIPPIAIYATIYNTLIEPEDENHFVLLKQLIFKNIEGFPIDEAKEIYDSATNYCIAKINQGIFKYNLEYLELSKIGLRNGVLLLKGEITPGSFKNIITAALRLKEYDWTEKFVIEFGPKLIDEYRENAITYSLAQLYYYQKQFDQVKSLLQKVEYKGDNYSLGAKVILMVTYFDLDEFDALSSLLDSFNKYILRNKLIAKDKKLGYLNLIKFTKQLMSGPKREKLELIKKEVNASTALMSKPWVLEKIEELEKK